MSCLSETRGPTAGAWVWPTGPPESCRALTVPPGLCRRPGAAFPGGGGKLIQECFSGPNWVPGPGVSPMPDMGHLAPRSGRCLSLTYSPVSSRLSTAQTSLTPALALLRLPAACVDLLGCPWSCRPPQSWVWACCWCWLVWASEGITCPPAALYPESLHWGLGSG